MSPPSNIGTIYVAAKTLNHLPALGNAASNAYFSYPRAKLILAGLTQDDIASHLQHWNVPSRSIYRVPCGLDAMLSWEHAKSVMDVNCLGRGVLLVAQPSQLYSQQRMGLDVLGEGYRIVLDPTLKRAANFGVVTQAKDYVGRVGSATSDVLASLGQGALGSLRKIRRPVKGGGAPSSPLEAVIPILP